MGKWQEGCRIVLSIFEQVGGGPGRRAPRYGGEERRNDDMGRNSRFRDGEMRGGIWGGG